MITGADQAALLGFGPDETLVANRVPGALTQEVRGAKAWDDAAQPGGIVSMTDNVLEFQAVCDAPAGPAPAQSARKLADTGADARGVIAASLIMMLAGASVLAFRARKHIN